MSIVQANFQHNDWAELCVMVNVKATVIDRSIFVVGHIRMDPSLHIVSVPLTPIMNECDEMEPSQSPFRFPFLLPFSLTSLCVRRCSLPPFALSGRGRKQRL